MSFFLVSADIEDSIIWLKNNSAPFSEVRDKWKLTTKYRTNEFPQTVSQYFKLYRALEEPLGYLLFEIDFCNLYPDKENLLFDTWDIISPFIYNIACEKKDLYLLQCLHEKNYTKGLCGNM